MNNFFTAIRSHACRAMRAFGHQQCALGAAVLVCALTACRKDKDTSPPQVSITAPAAGSSAQVPGWITVRADVHDNERVTAVTVSLSDELGAALAGSQTVTVDATSATIEVVLHVWDERIESTTGTITVRASDGSNEGRGFLDISVLEAPLRRRALFALHTPSAGPVTVHRADSVGTVAAFATLAQDFSAAVIDNYHRRLVIAGDQTGPLVGVDALTGQTAWSIANTGPGLNTWFTTLHRAADRRTWFAERDGSFKALRALDGVPQLNSTAQADRRIACFGSNGDRLVVQENGTSGPQRELVVRSSTTGTILDVQALDFDVTGMFAVNDDRMLLIGNDASGARIQERNITNGLPTELLSLPGEPVQRVVADGNGNHWLLFPTRIARYTEGSSGVSTLATLAANDIAFDAADGLLWAAVGNDALALDPVSGSTLGTVAFPASVDRLLVFLNR